MSNYQSNYTGAQIDAGIAKAQKIGDLSTLNTTDKNSLVGAINEVKGSVDTVYGAAFDESTTTPVDSTREATSTTYNYTLGTTIAEGTVCTVEITMANANPSQNTGFVWRNASGNLNSIGTIPAGDVSATFVDKAPSGGSADRIRINNAVTGNNYSVKITTVTTVDQIAANKLDIAALNANLSNCYNIIQEVNDKTPLASILTFSSGYWKGDGTAGSASYRVKAAEHTFTKTVQISSFDGYYFAGWRNGVWFDSASQFVAKAGEPVKIYMRKVWEDTSTPVTIAEMTDNAWILNYNPITDYQLLQHDFAGIEMFRTAGFIGDSYTAKRLGYSWVDIIQGITGVQTQKFAKSGDDCGAWLVDSANGLPALLSAPQKDLYWIALGINDGDRVDTNHSYLGSIADISGSYTAYPDTFYGNYAHIIEAIQNYAPSAKIVLYKPIFQKPSRTLWGQSSTKNGIEECREAIDEIGTYYSLPVMDALDDLFFRSSFYVGHLDADISNGTHPSVMLYSGIAKANLRLFSECIMKYDSYFMGINYPN